MATAQLQAAAWQTKIKALQSTQAELDKELQGSLSSLRSQIQQLKAKNAHMKQQLAVDKQDTSLAQQTRIDKLYELIDTYSRKVEVQSRQVEGMQHELELTHVKLQDIQRLTGGLQAAAESAKQAARSRQVLENRLEQVEKRFGAALAHNNTLRQEIERYNKEQLAFRQLCEKLERELQDTNAELETVHSSTAICEEALTLAMQQMTALRLQNEKEAAAAEVELAELKACQEADKALMQVQAERLSAATTALDQHGGPPQASELDPQLCSQLVSQLQAASGIQGDLPALVAHLSQLEALNFRLFNECNQANERVGAMQRELKSLQVEAQQVDEASGNARQKEVIRATQAKRDHALQRAEALTSKRVVLERRLALVRAGVGAALKCLGGQLVPAAKPEDADCVYATLLQNLGQLEARSRALVAVHSTLSGRNSAGAQAMLTAHLSTSKGRSGAVTLEAAAAQALMEPGPGMARPASAGNAAAAGGAGGGGLLIPQVVHGQQVAVGLRGTQGAKQKLGPTLSTITSEVVEDEGSESDDSDDGVPLTRQQLQARLGYAL